MNKSELARLIARDANISIDEAIRFIDALVKIVGVTLKKNSRIRIEGLGTFSVVNRASRRGTNPQTGKSIIIKEKRIVQYKASVHIKSNVAKKDKGTDYTGPRKPRNI